MRNIVTITDIKRGDIHFWKDSIKNPEVRRMVTHFKNVVIRTDERENKQTHMVEHDRVILRKGGDRIVVS